MTQAEVRRIEDIFLGLARCTPKLTILEWGSGGSTVHFTRFLRSKGVPYEWISIEYNRSWHERVSREVADDPATSVILFDVGNNNMKQRALPMNEYVEYPKTLGKKFDFVLVDGRKRRRAMLVAKEVLAEGGIVILHDAERHYYWPAFKAFPRGYFIGGRLFVGFLGDAKVGEKVRRSLSFILPFFYDAQIFLWRMKESLLGRWFSA